jgi:hypothetical protein
LPESLPFLCNFCEVDQTLNAQHVVLQWIAGKVGINDLDEFSPPDNAYRRARGRPFLASSSQSTAMPSHPPKGHALVDRGPTGPIRGIEAEQTGSNTQMPHLRGNGDRGSAQAIADLDELATTEPPRGYSRD